MRMSDWSSDVCSSDLLPARLTPGLDYRRFRVVCARLDFDRGPTAGTGRGGMTGWLQKASCIRGTGQDPLTIGLGITGRPERLVHSEPRTIFWGRVIYRGTDPISEKRHVGKKVVR